MLKERIQGESLLSRRDFLKIGAVFLTAAGYLSVRNNYHDQGLNKHMFSSVFLSESENSDTSFMDQLDPPKFTAPSNLMGVGVNSPFGYTRTDEYIRSSARQFSLLNAKYVRIFLNNRTEEVLGNINPGVLDGVDSYAHKVSTETENKVSTLVSLFDGYDAFRSDGPNFDYKNPPYNSAYFNNLPLVNSDPNYRLNEQIAFFTDPKRIEAFQNRIGIIIDRLKSNSDIAAWEVVNEADIPGMPISKLQPILTNWYSKIVKTIEEHDSTKYIVTGLKYPWYIDESKFAGSKLINSFHAYYEPTAYLFRGLRSHESYLPLVCTEIGFSDTLGGVRLPKELLLLAFQNYVLKSCIKDGRSRISGLAYWKIDEYADNYSINPDSEKFVRGTSCELAAKFGRF